MGGWLLIALVWLQRRNAFEHTSQPDLVWHLWLVTLAMSGLATATISTNKGFDSAPGVVAEIERRGLSGKRWIALPEWRAPAVSGRLDIAFERLGDDCRFTFVRWDHSYSALASKEALIASLEADIATNCLLYTSPSPRDQRGSRMPSSA